MNINKNIRLTLKGIIAFMLLCLFDGSSVFSQDLLWKANFTGSGEQQPGKSAIDLANNIYIIGTFNGSCNIPSPVLTTLGNNDIYISKYDQNGNHLWSRQIGGLVGDLATGIVISPDGEFIYVTGPFQGTIYAGSFNITSTGGTDGFLAKYNKDGNILWLKSIVYASGATNQRPNQMKLDQNNHLVICGWFFTQVILGNPTTNITLSTTQPIGMFISQFDTSGTIINARGFESSNSTTRLYTFDIDTSGYYISGYYKGTLITDLGTSVTSNSGSYDMFVYKVGNDLLGDWLIKTAGSGDDLLYSCSTDNQGFFYFGGHFKSSTLSVDSTATGILSGRVAINKTADGKSDIFFAKYRYDGQLQWFNTAGSKGDDLLYRALFKNGNFIAAGQYGDTLTFNNKTIYPKGNGDAFAIVQNQNDNLVYLMPFTGTGVEVGETAVVDNNGNFVVIGDYTSSRVYIAGQDSLDNSNSGTKDMFVAKFDKGSLSHFVTAITCYGASTGAINVTPEGTVVAPYTYSWTKVGDPSFTRSTEDISGLNSGSYRVSFTDALGYNKVDTITLVDPPQIIVSLVTSTNVTCFGGVNGAIDITATGGTGTLSYAWTTSGGSGVNATAQDQTTLSAGIYHVSVTDMNNCGATLNNNVITQPARITFNGTVVTKINGSLGAIDLSVQGGTQPYGYSWSGPIGFTATTEDISGLAVAGDYRVDVTDVNSCDGDTTMLVADAYVMNAYISAQQDVLCRGGNTGSVTVAVDSAVGNVTYAWSNGGNTPTISNLVASNYSVTVTDSKIPTPQTVVVNVTIEEPASPFTVSIARTNITCHDLNNGILDANPSGGTLPFSYSWTKEAQPYNGDNETLTGLSEGAYAVTVTDANNCTASATNSIVNPDVITFSGAVTDATCEVGKNDGGVTLSNIQGGTGVYSFLWSNGLTIQNLSLLAAGDYSVTVSDANNCQTTNNYVVGYEAPIIISLTPTDISCFGSANGILDAVVSGGHPGFTYNWSNGQTTPQINGLAPGPYSVTVTDNKSCAKTQSGSITEPEILAIGSYNQVNVSCFGGNSGSVSLNITGGTPIYSYTWDQGAGSSSIANNLPAGTYNVTVTDINNCTTNGTYNITEPAALSLSEDAASHSNVSCFEGTNGSLTLLPSGGSGEYQYSMDNGAWVDAPLFNNLTAGVYGFRLRDKNAITCSYNWPQSITITQPQVLVIGSANQVNVSCFGGNNGSVDLTVTGGTPQYSYTWDNGAGNNSTAANLIAGTYNVTVTDLNSCVANGTYNVTEPTAAILLSSPVATDVLCNGGSTGTISASASGGTTPYAYILKQNGIQTGNITGLSDGNFTSIPTGNNYTIEVTDINSCTPSTSGEISINEPSPILIDSVSVNDATLKIPTWNGSIQVYVSGGTSPYTYVLGSSLPDFSGLYQNLAPAKYVITINDANNCGSIKTDSIEVGDYTGIIPILNGTIKIYPNPTFGTVYFDFENIRFSSSFTLELVDLLGKVVYSVVISQADIVSGRYPIDMTGSAKGIYIIRIDGKLLKEKIIFY